VSAEFVWRMEDVLDLYAEYRRAGTGCLAVLFDPHRGWRHVAVAERRTRLDFAGWLKELADVHYPEAERIRVVLDNLNTHSPASLYAAFPPEEARRLARRLEFVYTPKHGSWLNLVEIELSVLADQCLDRRIPDLDALAAEVAAWGAERNAAGATVAWRFTRDHARIKLKHLYPYPA
jgi:hypothetical protein